MSRPTIRFVISDSNLMLTAQDRMNPPQVMPTRDPGLASSPSTFIGLHAMGIESPRSDSTDQEEESPEQQQQQQQQAKNTKMKRLWNAVKRAVRRPKNSAHPFADATAGGPGNRILVTHEFSVTSEPAPVLPSTAANPIAPATSTVRVDSPSKFEEYGKDGAATAEAPATAKTTATATATNVDGKNKKKAMVDKDADVEWEDGDDDEDEPQQQNPHFPTSFSRNFRRSMSAALPQFWH
ncbi:hypothetical protein F4820DRAFT_447838 [Hypoxylon rubiginosum]|uniref:Uncharacterized protein n=1 Tax=Hypoxylon rubiginosum TaxID=110542 RepID=A0ACB9Z1P5_9PEZI|nr:hypothetical protein F4820DRAFT_447838 [Hypoxylon rubiginosum]